MNVSLYSGPACCGIQEAVGVNRDDFTAKGFVLGIFKQYMSNHFIDRDKAADWLPQTYFTVAYKDEDDGFYHPEYKTRVDEIAKYIEKHNLGTCTISEPRVNRVHNSLIRMGVWSPNTAGLKEWAVKCKIKKAPDRPPATRW